ncbi:glycosyltransferase [Phyllobacterium sp. OV277]|uniref:glycosyltransferase n=1 Tax=Phyllobacterium sp. OV277 TaxID=1882772 RepID=UPI0008807282|nr:glycosyltransferase [Phyllobacterium sp. OV277]SDN97951.1 Glycosyltransferase, GT2 family [Phyllobacterium sp. OV277]
MTPDSMGVVAVVVTHNRSEELKQVVAALLSQTLKPDHIVVIDNASTIPVVAGTPSSSTFHVVRSEINHGGAGGFALGLETGLSFNPKWIWLLDDDAVPHPSALECLLEVHCQLPAKTGAMCPAVYEFGSLALMHRRKYSHALGIETPVSAENYVVATHEIDTASFVGFLVLTDAVREIGMPDIRFFVSYDDIEYSLRLKKFGWRIWLVPASQIDHMRVQASRMRHSQFGVKHYYNVRNMVFLSGEYSEFKFLSIFLAIITGIAIWAVSRKKFSVMSLRMLFRAIWDGLKGRLGEF